MSLSDLIINELSKARPINYDPYSLKELLTIEDVFILEREKYNFNKGKV